MRKADYIERAEYFEMRSREYRHIASETLNKVIAYNGERLAKEYDEAAAISRRRAEEVE